MESNKQERKNLVNDNPMAKRASEGSPAKNLNKGYGSEVKSPMAMMKSKKPSTAFAMKMSETRSALPMNETPLKKHKPGHIGDNPGTIKNATDVTTTTDNVSGRQSNTSTGGTVTTDGRLRADGNIDVSQTFSDGTGYGSTYSQKKINEHTNIPLEDQRDRNTGTGVLRTNRDGSTSYKQYSQNKGEMLNEINRVKKDSVFTGNKNAATTAYNKVLNSFKTNN
jgi:hypothetical protein